VGAPRQPAAGSPKGAKCWSTEAANVFVAEDLLDGAEVGSGFEEMGREGVAEGVARDSFLNSGLRCRAFDRLIIHFSVEVMTTSNSALGIG